MKNLTPLLVIALMLMMSSNDTHAQTVNEGAWMIGGSFAFTTYKYKNDDKGYTWFNLAPDAAYYFMDDFAVGLEMDIWTISHDGNSNSSFYLSPFVRYYIVDPVFAQISYGFDLSEGGGSLFSIEAGYSWFLSNAVALEPKLFLDIANEKDDDDSFTEFGLAVSLQVFLNRD